ncbi:TIGR03618 family F420-dependent PPOX class oxidoreductase [Gordonia sp. HNM0687]|uniref:TIGR03618 family F420-dependent PPOX class oxidoreductase n=1 Tax=Gordonia mangrovi TaxID=2665643 RepID=A0A6L7GIT8_9ACTN|nr:PPOX class F420-dependent oxidoreductase [Gordonia mangrovi]MXP19774.1 TIGR03618 family F420-dependent PPOX class oxidoreductase [Gordonia mangrovi]UVF79599.1 PPOX class F420-dependent oxidoreductase [Gordonia mangrovi]
MSTGPLPPTVREMLAQPNPSVMATLRKDGSPVSAATWYLMDGDRVLLNMDDGRARLGHLRRDPRVTLTVLAENWYTHVTLLGRVIELRADDELADIDRLSRHYTGNPYPQRDRPRTTAVMEVERWFGWGEMKDNDQPQSVVS